MSFFALLLAFLLIEGPLTGTAMAAEPEAQPEEICAKYIALHEKNLGLPSHLLNAIALTEAGRWDEKKGRRLAWPWTINAQGKGHFYKTKAEALEAINKLKGQGVTNIDVGCMQVNLHYHPKAFKNLADALDPDQNVAYAATFLKRLRQERKSWAQAVSYYHSATWARHSVYRMKVLQYWSQAWREDRIERLSKLLTTHRNREEALP